MTEDERKSVDESNARSPAEDWAYFDDNGDVRCRLCERQVSTKPDKTHECPGGIG